MKDKKSKLRELFSRFLSCMRERKEEKKITQEDVDALYKMLEDYKKEHGL